MTITETPAAPTPKKPKKRKPRKARPRPARAAPQNEADAYPGLTTHQCAKACNIDACVISGRPYCAHPRKGGLQTGDMGNADAVARLHEAQKQLARADAEKRFT